MREKKIIYENRTQHEHPYFGTSYEDEFKRLIDAINFLSNRVADLEHNEELRLEEERMRMEYPAVQKAYEHYEFTKNLCAEPKD